MMFRNAIISQPTMKIKFFFKNSRHPTTMQWLTYPAVPVSAKYSPLFNLPGWKVNSVDRCIAPTSFPSVISRANSTPGNIRDTKLMYIRLMLYSDIKIKFV